MKRMIAGIIVTAALATSSASLAQTPPGAPPGPPPPPSASDGGRPEGPRRGPPDGEREGGWRPHPMMGAMMKGGHLRFRRGETGIDFKCAADDSTKACVDALMPLVDKLLQGR
ncbi:hypothetical protein [Methylobacterium sp. ID0610]|uniref:hypothetical protein n=1 Tax=Methylobacterium carpenticola TaxID=3344827 RepID=UPI0036BEA3F7